MADTGAKSKIIKTLLIVQIIKNKNKNNKDKISLPYFFADINYNCLFEASQIFYIIANEFNRILYIDFFKLRVAIIQCSVMFAESGFSFQFQFNFSFPYTDQM